MKTLVLSDIHANLNALDAVLTHAGEIDAVWFLGDLTGYGPDPNECVARMRQLPELVCLTGNHDAAVLSKIDVMDFNDEARYTVLWTAEIMTPENLAFLSSCPAKYTTGAYTLVHASPRQPVWEYILDTSTARMNFRHFSTDVCLTGHTHLPAMFLKQGNHHVRLEVPPIDREIEITGRAIINPGSVGQPRDYNPDAAYALLDEENRVITFKRVAYDVRSVQARMLAASLPERHIYRLSAGY